MRCEDAGPLGALAVTCVGTIVLIGTNAPEGSVVFTLAFLTYYVATVLPIGRAAMGLLGVFVTLGSLSSFDTPGMNALGVARFSAFFSIVWAAGIVVRARREAASALLRNEAERAENVVERGARAVAEERLRIAQELHDVVAHSISVIAVQAGVGTHFVRSDMLKTDAALQAIRQTAQSTLNELRCMLGVLRSVDDETQRAPALGLDQLTRLVGEVRWLGISVEFELEHHLVETHPGLEMSVYRVIQESLTNVLRHAGRTTLVSVKVQRRGNALVVEVTDDGDGAAIDGRAGKLASPGL